MLIHNSQKVYRSLRYVPVRLCSEEKSIYQKHEDGVKPRLVHGHVLQEWRKPWIQREGEWQSKLNIFVERNPSIEIMSGLERLPYLTVQDVKDWWKKMKNIQEIQNQRFLIERVAKLGSNLAALHFFTYRGCKVRLRGSNEWIKGDALNLELPDKFVDGYFVEAIDCENFIHNGIRYEGIQNLLGLNFFKWLSLKNNKYVDEWCLDRLAGQNGKSIQYLDISGCKFNVGCVYALAKMEALKVLIVTDPGENVELQVALAMLEKEKTGLLIKTVENMNIEKKLLP